MEWFEYYLLATFLLGLLQLRHHIALYRLILKTPMRWPNVYRVLRENLSQLITWPTVFIVGVMWTLWLLHTLLRRLLWPTAEVTPLSLGDNVGLLWVVILAGVVMVSLDVRGLLRAVQFRRPRMTWVIDLTELGLKAEVLPLKWLVRWRLRTKVLRSMPLLRRWMWRRSAEVAARLCFGGALWVSWATGTA